VVVYNLNVVCVAIPPNETDSPLIVDANAVLSSTVALERFEMVARWNTKFLQRPGSVQVEQLPPRDALHGLEPEHGPILEQLFRVMVSKRSDQELSYDVPGIPSSVISGGIPLAIPPGVARKHIQR
jgi:hypothetical protein